MTTVTWLYERGRDFYGCGLWVDSVHFLPIQTEQCFSTSKPGRLWSSAISDDNDSDIITDQE